MKFNGIDFYTYFKNYPDEKDISANTAGPIFPPNCKRRWMKSPKPISLVVNPASL